MASPGKERKNAGSPQKRGEMLDIISLEEGVMHAREATVLKISRQADGSQEVALKADLPTNCERMNVMCGPHRLTVRLDRSRPEPPPHLKVTVPGDVELTEGQVLTAEFFHPGEQAGAR